MEPNKTTQPFLKKSLQDNVSTYSAVSILEIDENYPIDRHLEKESNLDREQHSTNHCEDLKDFSPYYDKEDKDKNNDKELYSSLLEIYDSCDVKELYGEECEENVVNDNYSNDEYLISDEEYFSNEEEEDEKYLSKSCYNLEESESSESSESSKSSELEEELVNDVINEPINEKHENDNHFLEKFLKPTTSSSQPEDIKSFEEGNNTEKYAKYLKKYGFKHYSTILTKVNTKKEMGKNINTPKFNARLFVQHIQEYQQKYLSAGAPHGKYYRQLTAFCKKFYTSILLLKKQVSIAVLNELLEFKAKEINNNHHQQHHQEQENNTYENFMKECHKINREVMCDILKRNSKDEILNNNKTKNDLSYLNMGKVFRLRCRSRHLIQKMKSK